MSKDLNKIIREEKVFIFLLTAIQFFNILDFVILLPLGPALMRYFEISPGQFSLLASSYSLSAGIVGLLYSSIADQFNRKKLLMIVLFFFIAATLLCAIAPNFELLLIARSFAGVFGGIITPLVYAIVTDLIPFERRGKAMGTVMASFSFTSILGIPLGLAISDMFNWRSTFHFIGAGMTLVLLINLKVLPTLPTNGKRLPIKETLSRLWCIFILPKFRNAYLIMSIFTASGFLLFPFLSPYAVNNIGLQESDLKYIYLVGGIFTVFSSKYAGRLTDTYGSLKVFLPSLVLSLPFIYLYTSIGKTPLVYLLIVSTGFMAFINFRFVPVMTQITKLPSQANRGTFMGVLLSLRSFSSAVATAFSGYFIVENKDKLIENFDNIGYLSITLSLCGAILFFRMLKNLKETND